MSWSAPTSNREAYRRAGGRRRYQEQRRQRAFVRQYAIFEAWCRHEIHLVTDHGVQARLARQLGVSEATISRDVATILSWLNGK